MIKEVKYSYFVAWAYEVEGKPFSVGNSVLSLSEKLLKEEQFHRLEEALKRAIKDTQDLLVDLCITSITYLGEVEE
jgi:hypothetical protein